MALDGTVAGEGMTTLGRRGQSPDSVATVPFRDVDRDTSTAGRWCWRVAVRVGEMAYHPIVSATSEAKARAKATTVMHADVVRGALRLHAEDSHVTNQYVADDELMADLIMRVPLEYGS